MNKIIILKIKKNQELGFSLLEVLVAMLIASFFVVGSMQAIVLSTALRVQAQAKQRSNQLIQEDIEQVKLTASNLATNHSLCSATSFDASNDGDTTLDSYAESLFYGLPAVPATKYLIESDSSSKSYTLTRTQDETNSTAKKLRINYEVTDSSEKLITDSNIQDYIEVIPDAAINCP